MVFSFIAILLHFRIGQNQEAESMARIQNDFIAETVLAYPDQFCRD